MTNFARICLLSWIFIPWVMYGQPFGDCAKAQELSLSLKSYAFDFQAPEGPGEINEIEAPRGDPYFFRQEHFTHWFTFETPFTGTLSLEIIPRDIQDDYDFLLFRDSSGNFCEGLLAKEVRPIRSGISRNDTSLNSRTGLNAYARRAFQEEGPGDAFTKAIEVAKGNRYYLVIDNVYGGGQGYQLLFHFYYAPRLTGTISDAETERPLQGQVLIEDFETGKVVDSLQTEAESGTFSGEIPLDYLKEYRLVFYAPGYFMKSLKVDYPSLRKNRGRPMEVALDPIREGANLRLENINFQPGSPNFLPSTYPHLKAAYDLMRRYPDLEVEVEGHVNGVGIPNCDSDTFSIQLSWQRAEAVRNFLIAKGVDPDRMRVKGYGCSQMLFPNGRTEEQLIQNRRVELRVLKY
jgi:outer membrane protein OmpA-like peptidoglycan-associated protein